MELQGKNRGNFFGRVDWLSILIFFILVTIGWLNIYAAVYDEEAQRSIFDLSINSGKQLLWVGTTIILITIIFAVDFKFYDSFAYVIYGAVMLSLILVLIFGREVAGSKSWMEIGPFRLQPAEFAKFATALAVAKFLSDPGLRMDKFETYRNAFIWIVIPMLLIHLQGDTGSALVFLALVLAFYREGLTPLIMVVTFIVGVVCLMALLYPTIYVIGGLAVIAFLLAWFGERTKKRIITIIAGFGILCSVAFGVNYFVYNVLKPHQQGRVKALIDPDGDPLGVGWNVTQSKIAIGSGGFWGKGFLNGTQTKFDFVPEQSTDFIFCTIGEEHGWIGSVGVVFLFAFLMYRLIFLAERQKSRFARVYGYSVVSIIFFHWFVNVAMTIGLFPVIGIPLPLVSYGGSSLWAFTILIFIFLKLDAHRMQVMVR
ncbi:rod shape-determining protein RodA [Persicobacter diffluens]|uniref:Cell wall polymerase n=1 Tax=Persicobacter diffluens TaxID=981 RepID=A0AAN4VWC2_9BACT|nr:rod shape-determining protein RodA [Persicobacter diffluens]